MPKIGMFSVDWSFKENPDGTSDAFANAANYWRLVLPARELAKHGWNTVHSFNFEIADDGHLRIQSPDSEWHDDCDIIIIQRWMQKGFDKVTKRARACGQIIINELDDNYWALPRTNISRTYSDPAKFPDFNREAYLKNVMAGDAITVSTPTLAKQLTRPNGPPVYLCRNAIDIDAWEVRDPLEPGLVGWVGGLPWRGHDLQILRQGVVQFLMDSNLNFYHGGHIGEPGAPSAHEQLGMPEDKVLTRPLCDIVAYPNLWRPISVAVIPLEDTLFNRSKSWVKGLEACAMGVPFIASKLPEYEELGVGRLVDQRNPHAADEWVDNLMDLLDPEVRKVESQRNRARAEGLSVQKNWTAWDAIYKQFVSLPVAA